MDLIRLMDQAHLLDSVCQLRHLNSKCQMKTIVLPGRSLIEKLLQPLLLLLLEEEG